jgi:hypothetical protein
MQEARNDRMGLAMQSSHTVGTHTVRARRARIRNLSLHARVRRLLASIIDGSDHPCWRTPDPSAQMALLPTREQKRLFDADRVPRSR